jgi:hypothetical protein
MMLKGFVWSLQLCRTWAVLCDGLHDGVYLAVSVQQMCRMYQDLATMCSETQYTLNYSLSKFVYRPLWLQVDRYYGKGH